MHCLLIGLYDLYLLFVFVDQVLQSEFNQRLSINCLCFELGIALLLLEVLTVGLAEVALYGSHFLSEGFHLILIIKPYLDNFCLCFHYVFLPFFYNLLLLFDFGLYGGEFLGECFEGFILVFLLLPELVNVIP